MMYGWANSAHSVFVVAVLPIFYNTVAEYTGDAVSGMSTRGCAAGGATIDAAAPWGVLSVPLVFFVGCGLYFFALPRCLNKD